MKNYLSLGLLILGICFTSKVYGQLDTFEKNEIRFSLIGNSVFRNNIDNRIVSRDGFYDPTITFLRQFSNSKYYFKTDLSGFYNPRYQTLVPRSGLDGYNVNHGLLKYFNIYLGVERQMKFKHWGLFLGIGTRGGIINYASDIDLNSELVKDFQSNEQYLGMAGQATAYTNFTDKAYFFVTSTQYAHYTQKSYNQKINKDCCKEYKG